MTFYVNTESACFLCSGKHMTEDDTIIHGKGSPETTIKIEDGYISSSEISLLSIFRYLQLNFKKLFGGRGEQDTSKLLADEKASDILVMLCKQCSNIIMPLSKLCLELELLQMKVDHCLKSVCGVLENSKCDNSSVDSIRSHHHSVAQLLRTEMKRKCHSKLSKAVPKVTLFKDSSILPSNRVFGMTPSPCSEVAAGENSFSDDDSDSSTSTSMSSISTQSIVIRKANSVEKKSKEKVAHLKPSESTSKQVPNFNYQTCTLCRPPRPVSVFEGPRHHTRHHIENWFESSRLSHVLLDEFKEYCNHVVEVELLACEKLYNANGNRVAKCTYCSFSLTVENSMMKLRHHVCSLHKEVLARKIRKLQQSTTFEELKSSQQPVSSLFKEVNHAKKCDICGKVFQHYPNLWKHKKVQHGKFTVRKKVSKCNVCGKVFETVRGLSKHKNVKHGITSTPVGGIYNCDICGVKVCSSSSFWRHKRRAHPQQPKRMSSPLSFHSNKSKVKVESPGDHPKVHAFSDNDGINISVKDQKGNVFRGTGQQAVKFHHDGEGDFNIASNEVDAHSSDHESEIKIALDNVLL